MVRNKLGARYIAFFATSADDATPLIHRNMHYLVSARNLKDIFDLASHLVKNYNTTVTRALVRQSGAWLYPRRDFRAKDITTDKTIIGYVGTTVPIYLYREAGDK